MNLLKVIFLSIVSLSLPLLVQAQCDSISGFDKLGLVANHAYYMSDNSVPWQQAKTLAENEGGYLATIKDTAENNFLKDHLNGELVFIGYNDSSAEGIGQWANNEPVSMDLSYNNTDENDYAVMNFWNGAWEMNNGLGHRKFVMEKACGALDPAHVVIDSLACAGGFPLIQSFSVTIWVTNEGEMPSEPKNLYLKRTYIHTGLIRPNLGTFAIPTLQPGETVSLTTSANDLGLIPGIYGAVSFPTKWGHYYLSYISHITSDDDVYEKTFSFYWNKYKTDLDIKIGGDFSISSDGKVRHTVTISNNGPEKAYNVQHTIGPLQYGSQVDIISGNPTILVNTYVGPQWYIKSLDVGESETIEVSYFPKQYSGETMEFTKYFSVWSGHNTNTYNTDTVTFNVSGCRSIPNYSKLGELNGVGYYMSHQEENWQQAKSLSENEGGHLASIHTQAENDFLKDRLNGDMVFIGYNDATSEGVGQWANNEPVTFDLSYNNTSEKDYGVMNFWNGEWEMNNGLGHRKYVMEKECPTVCLPGGITFGYQSEVDSFPMKYPGCTEIFGNVALYHQVTNTDSLIQIERINGQLSFENVTSIAGLENLTYCRGLSLKKDFEEGSFSSLKDVDGDLHLGSLLTLTKGLEHIETIEGNIHSGWSSGFVSLDGLKRLTTLNGRLYIYQSSVTANLPMLEYMGGLNVSTSNFNTSGLGNVTQMGELKCTGGAQVDLSGLTKLTKVDGMVSILTGTAVSGISGLQNLTQIGGLSLKYGSTGIANLDFLSGLDTMNSLILNQVEISDISAIENVNAMDYVYIKNCPKLTECSIQPVCDLIATNGNVEIENNGSYLSSGCMNIQEVEAACNDISDCEPIDGFNKLDEHNNHAYYLAENPAPWQQAKSLTEDIGGYLVTIKDYAENDFLKDQLSDKMVFIGYNDEITESVGQWANNEPVTLDLSYNNTAENDYGVMNFWNGEWQLTNGLGHRQYVMEVECATSCLVNGFTFKTQGDVDSFPKKYPRCTEILGHVTFENQALNTDSLIQLEYIENLTIKNELDVSGLKNISYIDILTLKSNIGNGNFTNLKVVGSIEMRSGSSLTTGLENVEVVLERVTAFWDNNPVDFSGLKNLSRIEQQFFIVGRDVIDVSGLGNLEYIRDIFLLDSGFDTYGLESLTEIGSNFNVSNCKIDFRGLANLKKIGGELHLFTAYKNIVNWDSLSNLEFLKSLDIYRISDLTNLDFLSNVTNLKTVDLYKAEFLTSIEGLAGMTTLDSVSIRECRFLTECSIQPICDLIAAGGNVIIENNGYFAENGCLNIQEVEGECIGCGSEDDYTFLGIHNNHGYYLSDTTVYWQDAKTYAEDAGGYLTTINDQAENDFLLSAIDDIFVIIGYNDEAVEGVGQWANNEPVAFDLSYNNSVSRDYALMNFWNGEWKMYEGLGYRKFVMEKDCPESSLAPLRKNLKTHDAFLFPNPANDKITIQFELRSSQEIEINVYDMLGKSVRYHKETALGGLYQKSIPIANLETGTYLIKVSGADVQNEMRFVKE